MMIKECESCFLGELIPLIKGVFHESVLVQLCNLSTW